ncbi:acyl-CoA dehydrogenase family protein [Sphingomonas colocasiae]|uniref:Acyl-CoA dehydrogenase family protein n=1 Tax=Sphingomonas colocasiae TaxID=1848973 RepID=A0ABS7PQG2_9SPHN|nr:acyl-CoA dehydrogenase family protein [Sphingomonas colocasiae]MBY8823567.1 acyl-CoA dehydrogenase family protein [Sphingomonas colocasiae]
MIARAYLADLVGGVGRPAVSSEDGRAFHHWLEAFGRAAASIDAAAWQARKAEAGWSRLGWPKAADGRPVPLWELHRLRVLEEEIAPAATRLRLGLDAVAPMLMGHGRADQQAALLPHIASGQAIWTALFAEPGSGLSIGNPETVATRGDGGWRISGKKIWCRFAGLATHAILLAHTGATAGQAGCSTCFIVELPAPGVRILPIPLTSGRADFDEVLLDDIWVPETNRLGDIGAGWAVAGILRGFASARLDARALEASERLLAAARPDAGDMAMLSTLDATLRRLGHFESIANAEDFGLNRAVAELLARRLTGEVARLRQAGSSLGEDDRFDGLAAELQLENGPNHRFLSELGAAILGSGR